jgi:FkbM family methyltransferase
MLDEYYALKDGNGIYIDKKLDELFNKKMNGFFIELGANNGILQSNTFFLEKNRNWKGILIEPSLDNYKACIINRPNSTCFNYACVSDNFNDNKIIGDFNLGNNPQSLMSSVNSNRQKGHGGINIKEIEVPCITLNKILDQIKPLIIDLLILDVEGYEFEVLKGLNLKKYRPEYMLIEIYTKDFNEIIKFLNDNNYKLIENFSNYNKSNNKNWDGTHNDYLLKTMI